MMFNERCVTRDESYANGARVQGDFKWFYENNGRFIWGRMRDNKVGPFINIIIICMFMLATSPLFSQSAPFERVRIDHDSQMLILELGTQRFTHPEKGDLYLVPTLHFGPRETFLKQQKKLDTIDVVLFECASSFHFEIDSTLTSYQREQLNRKRCQALAHYALEYYFYNHTIPPSFQAMEKDLIRRGKSIHVLLLRGLKINAYGHEFGFYRTDSSLNFTQNKRLMLTLEHFKRFTPRPEPDQIYAQKMGFVTQYSVIRYDRDTFEHCDLDMQTVLNRLAHETALSVQTLSQKRAHFDPNRRSNMAIATLMDSPQTDLAHIHAIQRLYVGQCREFEQEIKKVDPVTKRLILGMRNDHVISRLKSIQHGDKRSYAVYFGVAHMVDLVHAIQTSLGYTYVETHWDTFCAVPNDLSEGDIGR